jgi:hypothetical protein
MAQPVRRRRRHQQTPAPVTPPTPPRGNQSLGPEDPAIMAMQVEAFELRVGGASIEEIRKHLGVKRERVLDFIHNETKLRVTELKGSRMSHIAVSVARYEGIILRCLSRIADLTVREARVAGSGRGAFLEERTIIEAQKRIDALLGLTVVIKGEEDPMGAGELEAAQDIIAMLANLPPDMRLEAMRDAREKRKQLAPAVTMVNVTPAREPVTIDLVE